MTSNKVFHDLSLEMYFKLTPKITLRQLDTVFCSYANDDNRVETRSINLHFILTLRHRFLNCDQSLIIDMMSDIFVFSV